MDIKKRFKQIVASALSVITIISALPLSPPGYAAMQPREGSIRYPADSYGATGKTDKEDKVCEALFKYDKMPVSALALNISKISVNPQSDKDHPDAGGTYTGYCMDYKKYGTGDNGLGYYDLNLYGPNDKELAGLANASVSKVLAHKDRLIAAIKLGYDGTDKNWNQKEAFKSFYGVAGKPNLESIYAYGATKMAVWSIMEGWEPSAVQLRTGVDSRVMDAYQYIMAISEKDKNATASNLNITVAPIDGLKWKESGKYKTISFEVSFADKTALNRIDTGGDDSGKVSLKWTDVAAELIPGAVFTQYDDVESILHDGDKIIRKNEQYKFKLRVDKEAEIKDIPEGTMMAEVQAIWDQRKMASVLIGLPKNGNYQPYLVFGGLGMAHANVTYGKITIPPPPPPDGGGDDDHNDKNGQVSIKKVDKANKTKGLAGATFRIESKAAGYSANGITGSDGTYSWNNLPFLTKDVPFTYTETDEKGNSTDKTVMQTVQVATDYVVTEVSPPPGYKLPSGADATWQFTIDPEKETSLSYTFEDEIELGDLEIIKVDSQDGSETLSGASFTITHVETGKTFSGTTGNDGTLKFTNIPTGVYKVHEDAPPSGYIVNPMDESVVVMGKASDTDATSITVTNGRKPTLKIRKVDEATNKPLKGATFRVTHTDGATVGDYTVTDDDGFVTLDNLMPGAYTITETRAPDGYVLDAPPQNIVLNEGEDKEIIFKDSMKPQIIVKKISEKGSEPLPGAVLQLSTPNGQPLKTYTTDEKGEVVISGLAPGSYVIKEVTPPAGYLVNNQIYTIEITAGQAGEQAGIVTIKDQEIPGFLLRKVDAMSGKPLSGAKFAISKPDVPGSEKIYTTDDEGAIFIKESDISDTNAYVVKEVEAPAGYILNETPVTVRLEANTLKTLVWKNEQKPGIHIYKLDADTNTRLNGAVIRVSTAGGSELGVYTTGQGEGAGTGEIWIRSLNPGTYQLEEITAPTGYYLEPQKQTVTLEAGRVAEVTFTDHAQPGLQIIKKDEKTGQVLKGARFVLKTVAGVTVGEYETDSTGRIYLDKLDPGMYTVEELSAPEGYLKDSEKKTVTLEQGKTTYVTFTNKPKPDLEIVKLDATDSSPLPGAVFRVTRTDGSLVGEYTSNSEGKILIQRLDPGLYTIEETKAPNDYLLNSERKNVTLEWGKTTSVVFTNKAKPEMRILKIDELSGNALAGAVFNVKIKNGKDLGNFTSDANGIVNLGKLDPGLYVISEIKAPDGYNVTNLPQEIQLDWGDKKTVEVRDKALSPLYIRKTDAKTGGPVAGAVFKVQKMNGELVGQYTTDVTGFISLPRVDPGYYIVTEISAPPGYQVDNVPKTVEVKLGQPAVVDFTDKPHGNLVLKKLDADTWKPLANAVFKVETVGGNYIGEYTSDANGDVTIPQLEPGSYKVSEVRAPDGYLINSAAQTVELKWGATSVLTFTDTKIMGLTIQKIDSDTKEALPGAVFTIAKSSGEKVGEFTSDENGLVVIPKLEPGDYTVTEIKAPSGYVIDSAGKTVTMQAGKPATLTFTNTANPGLSIKKIDAETKEALTGAVFTITKANGEKVGEYVTDENGLITLPELAPGDYIVTEIKSPAGYVIDTSSKPVTMQAGKSVVLTFTNTRKPGLSIAKIDAESRQVLPGAVFLVEKSSGEKIGEFTTDENGVIYLPDLQPGEYDLTELKAPTGYVLDTSKKHVILEAGKPQVVTFTNKAKAALQLQKVDAVTGKGIAGAVFKVTKQNGEFVGDFTSDASGLINIPGAEPGWYVVVETKAPDGYLLNSVPQTVEMKTGAPTKVTFTNQPIKGLTIQKIDADSRNPLPGAVFTVDKADGSRLGEYTSDENGLVIIPQVEPGNYVITEVKAPDGYILVTASKNVTIEAGKAMAITMTNKKLTGLQLQKIDADTKAPLAGASFRIEKANGERVGEFTTDEAGFINIPELEPGEYSVTEIKAPDGYVIDTASKKVTITAGKPSVMTFTNHAKAALHIQKIDGTTNKPIAGVTFRVTTQDGRLVGEYTTDTTGLITIPDVEPGWYVVSEIRCPDGYILDTTPQTIEVKTGAPAKLTFINQPLKGLTIQKLDADSRKPLPGAVFTVDKADGSQLGEYTSDENGLVIIPQIAPGNYVITEVKAPDGYILVTASKNVTVETGKAMAITMTNKKLTGLQLQKIDAETKAPLAGATFRIEKAKGERVGEFTTDETGMIPFQNWLPATTLSAKSKPRMAMSWIRPQRISPSRRGRPPRSPSPTAQRARWKSRSLMR